MQVVRLLILSIFCAVIMAGCGGEPLPFEAEYLSENKVKVKYQEKTYLLDRYGVPAKTPFAYQFEQDGDLDLTIDGKEYEVDSPYDIDKKKTKKKKKKTTARKKTSSKSSTSKK